MNFWRDSFLVTVTAFIKITFLVKVTIWSYVSFDFRRNQFDCNFWENYQSMRRWKVELTKKCFNEIVRNVMIHFSKLWQITNRLQHISRLHLLIDNRSFKPKRSAKQCLVDLSNNRWEYRFTSVKYYRVDWKSSVKKVPATIVTTDILMTKWWSSPTAWYNNSN